MDIKGIELPGLNPVIASLIKNDKKDSPAVRPVEKVDKNIFRSLLEGGESFTRTLSEKIASLTREERAQLAAEVLSEGLTDNPDLDVSWTFAEEAGMLVVEIKNKHTGEILRQIPPEEILGIDISSTKQSGILINKTA